MRTHTYNIPGFKVQVEQTVYHYRCRVYPNRLDYGFFQGLAIQASHPASAAYKAVEEFAKLYPNSPTCATCKHFRTLKVDDMDGFTREHSYCGILGIKAGRSACNTCKRHKKA